MKVQRLLYILFLIFLFSSCGSSRYIQKQTDAEIESLIDYAYRYVGTPYRSGGTTPRGFDCSGYVQYVFREFNYSLPRSSSDQSRVGKKIKKSKDLRRGDLVFFKGRNKRSKKVGHVGIVVDVDRKGNYRFIHASTSRGIIITNISELYYKDRYLTARRIIE